MSFLSTTIIIAVFVGIIYGIYKLATGQDAIDPYILKGRFLIDLEKGKRWEIDVDYNNLNDVIRYDDNTKNPYIIRKTRWRDRGPTRIELKNWWMKDYDGMQLFLNNINVISATMANLLTEKEEKIIELENKNAFLFNRVIEVENKLKDELKTQIDLHKDMKEAAALVIREKKR